MPRVAYPATRLGMDVGMDIAGAIVAHLVALAIGFNRDPVDPRARDPLALDAGREVGGHDADIPDQPVHERLHLLGQAAEADRLAEIGAGRGVLERRPIDREVAVQSFPDRAEKHRQGTGEEFISIHDSIPIRFSCIAGTFRGAVSPGHCPPAGGTKPATPRIRGRAPERRPATA